MEVLLSEAVQVKPSVKVAARATCAPFVWAKCHPEWTATGVLGLALVWSYWSTLTTMADRWSRDPQYSHGFLVPVFALVLLFLRRQLWVKRAWEPSAWGLVLLTAGVGNHLTGARIGVDFMDAFSLLLTLAGLVLLVGGKDLLRWSWPAIAFLGFMLPLPYAVEQSLSQPLRRLATVMSTYLLETLGYPAIAEGNIILIEDMQLGVADACSGLGMLMTFFALSTAFAIVMRGNWVDRTVIVVSAIPIAVLVNVLRITITGVAYAEWGRDTAMYLMHDLAGWLMPPMALFLLWLELLLLDKLLLEVEAPTPLKVAGAGENFSSRVSDRE